MEANLATLTGFAIVSTEEEEGEDECEGEGAGVCLSDAAYQLISDRLIPGKRLLTGSRCASSDAASAR